MKPKKKTAQGKQAARRAVASSKESQTSTRRGARQAAVAGNAEPTRAEVETKEHVAPMESAAVHRKTLKIPPILLEGDESSAPTVGGPGQRYALGPTPPLAQAQVGETAELGELPEAYGTERLLLGARDPHWLYAHWDLSREQQREYNRRSIDGHLVLRVFADKVAGEPFVETQLNPESRSWFVHVGRGGKKFVATLGFYAKTSARWTQVSVSAPAFTPPDSLSPDTSVEFATIPIGVSYEKLLATLRAATGESVPLTEAILQLRAEDPTRWTLEQERELAELISMDAARRPWGGSLEIIELIRDLSSLAVTSVSSPFGGVPGRSEFWFKINADLIVYGSTEPDAKVVIGGRNIRLRPDGSFSYRFTLPDGHYELPITAISADQTDGRAAELRFDRQTEYRGDVGTHPADAGLKSLRAENVTC